jgi:fused signal recognition particle receptor
MADQADPPISSDEPQAPAAPRRKAGFFTRLFENKNIEEAEETLRALEQQDLNLEPPSEEEEKKGAFSRWFGRRAKAEPGTEEPPRASWFQRLRDRLGLTRRSLLDQVKSILRLSGSLDADTIEDIEDVLIQGDVAIETTSKIIDRMKRAARSGEVKGEALFEVFKDSIHDILAYSAPGFDPVSTDGDPYVVMVTGVNGVGKTTTVAKMAARCTAAGLSTMLVAGDTFRAAAVEQLEIWAQRTGCEFVRGADRSDAAALCYDALQKARSRGIQVVFIDTAGRLHTKSSLMEELGKIQRVCTRVIPGSPHETLLVIDATTGQNAIQQVRLFSEAVKIDGLVMTKLDGTAKGGVLLSILDMFRIPITLVGVGEAVGDLRDFDADQFAAALFGDELRRDQ